MVVLKKMKVIKDDNSNSSGVSYQFLTDMAPKISSFKHIAAIFAWREPSMISMNDA